MTEPASGTPEELPRLDPDEFVGAPPAGDADAGAFTSNDQSADPGDVRAAGGDRRDDVSAEETLSDAGHEPEAGEASA
jgi:hypothetical protein